MSLLGMYIAPIDAFGRRRASMESKVLRHAPSICFSLGSESVGLPTSHLETRRLLGTVPFVGSKGEPIRYGSPKRNPEGVYTVSCHGTHDPSKTRLTGNRDLSECSKD